MTKTYGSLTEQEIFDLGTQLLQAKIDRVLRLDYVVWAGHSDYAKEALKGVIKQLAPALYTEILQAEIEKENKK
jgi:hypothetical protein